MAAAAAAPTPTAAAALIGLVNVAVSDFLFGSGALLYNLNIENQVNAR